MTRHRLPTALSIAFVAGCATNHVAPREEQRPPAIPVVIVGAPDGPEPAPVEADNTAASEAPPDASAEARPKRLRRLWLNAVKRHIRGYWRPNLVYDDESVPEAERKKTHLTVLTVRLNATGALVDAVVSTSSGVDALDQEAVRAMKKAQPFLPPPRDQVENGEIQFTFGFLWEPPDHYRGEGSVKTGVGVQPPGAAPPTAAAQPVAPPPSPAP
jgi:TonB family protein